ncbi:ATP-binding cassette sub-family A member 10-like [Puma concolor]|uniref:ATP-binding cassette sub-family A member 10-like n=1 Tax=Puma concolor TaxID=9696 RepID=A0A6P6I578_PUMCO|nr:ATP-binding cassette sub-family A member 10-like [Puma concolor]
MIKKKISVYQQTQALLYKNFLKKWRMKKESLSEWTITLLLGLYFCIFSGLFRATHLPEQPPHVLGRVDEFNDSDLVVAYTPVTNMTQKIIDKMSSASFMKGRKTIGVADKEMMDTVLLESHHEMVGIVFNDTFSYQLKLNWAYGLSIAEEHSEYSEHCWDMHDDIFCYVTRYWQNGFVAFQTAINAAIIELTTNHSVMETLTSVTGINMRMPSFISKGEVINTWFIFICIVYFSPFVYSTSLNVTKERKKCKKLMAVMGLRESAFWLSWGLMYAGFVFILSIAMALIITLSKTVVIVGFLVIVTLFVLYGLSLIALAFLLSVLIKKPVLTSLVGFLFTTFWGCLGFTVLYRQLPSSLGWILSLFSPFAFTAGMAQISRMDYYLMGVTFPDPSGESHVMMVTFFILALDALLYLILMLYFERALPDEGGHPCSPLFFLKSSFWSQHRNTHHEVFEDEINPEHYPDDSFEPVPLEFHGKEAIRIRNIRKEYDGKPENVEALQGIFLDIYEGQVTAILGHNGSGKSTLLNILSGLSVPTKGSATIYNTQLSEITNMEETRMNIGFCPQFNIQFDFLTVRENLRLFAKIKGIQSKEVEQEVKRVIMELDIQNTQDVIAKKLTGGQKRKLTLGIALLGDPQVLLLDEPTTGLDPFSKHQVWNLLKERKTNRVILFSTQIMDEADILADRKVFLSNGKLKCAGSSLFLKQKWGIGYHLSLRRNEMCNLERITSLIRRHVPDAKLRAESEEKLVYLLPLERTNKFPDLYRDLEKCSNQGIMNYDVSMTTLNEVFLNLEGKSTIDEPDVGIWKQEKVNETRDSGTESEMQQAPCSLPGLRKAISTRTLWRRQVCAMARLRFLKLRHERKLLLSLLLLLGIPLIPTIFVKIVVALSHSTHCRELSSSMYFLSLEQPSQTPLTSLLVINNTGSNIEDFMQALKRQDILLEVDDFRNRNGSDDPSYNGAIIVSGDRKDYRFSVVCNTKRMTCFPVLMGIVSNALLGIFNFTELIKTERSTFPFNGVLVEFGFVNGPLFLLVLANCLSPYIGMSSLSDRKQKTQSQLWISGLCPSAYWIGQALVDIPLYCSILLSVYLINCLMVLEVRFPLVLMFALVVCIVGCAASLIFFTYVISFIFLKRRKNNGLWCLGFLITPYDKKENDTLKVVLEGYRTSPRQPEDDTVKFLGYCPQENSLWPGLTGKDHLELYAAVKGMSKQEAALSTSRLVEAFKLQEQLKVPVKDLAQEVKRKLCFALSVLGDPSVVLLDEPSTGVDPEGQQQMWQAIQTIVKNTEKGVLLTTHSMAEAEAVCDRVAIMVSGKLRCIGSIQNLKSKFGKDYILEVKIKDPIQVEPVHTEILKLFPQAARQERYSSMMAYKLPVEAVRPLSQAFFKLEAVKQTFDLEEYSLSQATLEQVFLELSKEQELGNLDDEVDTTVRWKLLPQEEP